MTSDLQRLTEELIRFRSAVDSVNRAEYLERSLQMLGVRTGLPVSEGTSHPECDLEIALGFPSRRLAVYGSLAPGEANHRIIQSVKGIWSSGSVRGDRHEQVWGRTMGYPGFLWRPDGPRVKVALLESDDLPEHWGRLDAFEGSDYCRILLPIERDDGTTVVANLYAIRKRSE